MSTPQLTIIVGPPASGKTTLARQLQKEQAAYLIHTDDFIKRGEKACLDRIVYCTRLAENKQPIIVEGCWTATLLKDLIGEGVIPDKVIVMQTPLDVCIERYEVREAGNEKTYKHGMFGMVHGKFQAWLEWLPWQLRNHIDIQTVG